MIEVQGKFGIYATVLKHSISLSGVNLLTFELSYPRIVHSEFMTHAMICKNAASSRAIPFAKMQEQLTGRPVRFGQANPGMQDKGEDFDGLIAPGYSADDWWHLAKLSATNFSRGFQEAGYHKQVVNRLTEPFQMIKVVATATEWANFFWLRNHEAADPSLHELARVMYEAASTSEPQLLHPGEWHLPYVESYRGMDDKLHYHTSTGEMTSGCPEMGLEVKPIHMLLSLEEAIKVSTARTAAVSFRNVDYGVEKSEEVFAKLTSDARIHGSAMAHQATPMKALFKNGDNHPNFPESWELGVSHCDRNEQLWSAQFRGWIMHRKLIEGENVPGFIGRPARRREN